MSLIQHKRSVIIKKIFQTIENSDGTLSFECQHGPPECKANIIHACVLEILDDADKKLDVISCMIQDNILPDEALRTVKLSF